jgi:hypothetical protein
VRVRIEDQITNTFGRPLITVEARQEKKKIIITRYPSYIDEQ